MGKVLIVGVTGQVGGALAERLPAGDVRGTYRETPAAGAVRVDLAQVARRPEIADGLLAAEPVEAVFLCAAMTQVDACEEREDEATAVNAAAPAILAAAARRAGAAFVSFSTEYIFDGAAGPYAEDDPPNPVSAYGRSKLSGEHRVLAEHGGALVLRTTVVYGPEERGRNFAYRVAGTLAAGELLAAPGDQRSSPTYNRDLAGITLGLLAKGESGVWNAVGPEVMDRAEFARRLAAAAGLPTDLVREVETAALGQIAARPLDAGLRIDRLRAALPDLPLRDVEAAARHWTANPRGMPWPHP